MEVDYGELIECQLHRWYPMFRKHTIRTSSIQLSPQFVDFLQADGIKLPPGILPPGTAKGEEYEFSSDEESNHNKTPISDDEEEDQIPWELILEECENIQSQIDTLGGAVLPKLNWTAPKDATWMSCGETMQCSTVAEVILLLKGSDFVSHDLNFPFEYCSRESIADSKEAAERCISPSISLSQSGFPVMLNLRKWSNLTPSREFRCFVRERNVVGICQRDHKNFYPHLCEANSKERIKLAIVKFFNEIILSSFSLEKFVFDVYVDKNYRVWLIDFNPFGLVTDALLFTWEEIAGISGDMDFRVIESQIAIEPKSTLMYRLPKDLIDLSTKDGINRFAESFSRFEKEEALSTSQ